MAEISSIWYANHERKEQSPDSFSLASLPTYVFISLNPIPNLTWTPGAAFLIRERERIFSGILSYQVILSTCSVELSDADPRGISSIVSCRTHSDNFVACAAVTNRKIQKPPLVHPCWWESIPRPSGKPYVSITVGFFRQCDVSLRGVQLNKRQNERN